MDATQQERFFEAMKEFFPEIYDKLTPHLTYFSMDPEERLMEYSDGYSEKTTFFQRTEE